MADVCQCSLISALRLLIVEERPRLIVRVVHCDQDIHEKIDVYMFVCVYMTCRYVGLYAWADMIVEIQVRILKVRECVWPFAGFSLSQPWAFHRTYSSCRSPFNYLNPSTSRHETKSKEPCWICASCGTVSSTIWSFSTRSFWMLKKHSAIP